MSKFNSILKQYITELMVDPNTVAKTLGAKLGTPDQQTKNALDVVGAIAQSGDKDIIHQGLLKVLDPNAKEKFEDVFKSESEKAKALERLTSQGIPIGSVKQEKEDTQQNQPQNQSQSNTPTQSTQGNSTSYGGTTVGGELEGV